MGSFAGFGAKLAAMAVALPVAEHRALQKAAVLVEEAAKGAMGGYEFGWPPLAESTIERKATGDSPLLETGALQASIEHTVVGNEALIGTNDPHAIFMEMGTSKIPPRPFLMGAVDHKRDEIKDILKGEITAALKVGG